MRTIFSKHEVPGSALRTPAFFLLCFVVLAVQARPGAAPPNESGQAPIASGQAYRVATAKAAPPQELAAGVRDALGEEVIRVEGPAGVLCEIWLRKSVPGRATPSKELGIVYGSLADGTLLGAVRFPAAVTDYRSLRVQPGVYTLRYSLHPVDGNHMGVAPQRDFLLLAPAGVDTEVKPMGRDELIASSKKASGTGHPSVWSLVAAEGEAGAGPSMVHHEEEDHWVVRFGIRIEAGGATKIFPMALVVVGHAAEA